MGDRWTKIYFVAGALVLLGYLWVEARGVVFGGTDSRASMYWTSTGSGGRSGWGYTGGYFGGK